jgi:hypothetical protein
MIRKNNYIKDIRKNTYYKPFNDEFKCYGQNAPKPCGNWVE